MDTLTDKEKDLIVEEVSRSFAQLISAVNAMDTEGWSRHYSENFLSAMAGTEFLASRAAWTGFISDHFQARERQIIEPQAVRVSPLTGNLALLTSEETATMWLKQGGKHTSRHVFTMLWHKEQGGWKILHSHESWTDV